MYQHIQSSKLIQSFKFISKQQQKHNNNNIYSNIDTDIYNYTQNKYYNNYNSYTAIWIKIANKQYSKYEYITCFRFESNEYKDTTYYSYYIKCAQFEDICYNKNPWICNGHGMINSHSTNIENKCFCNHGYIGCDCTIRNTQTNKFNTQLIDNTCVENTEEDDEANCKLINSNSKFINGIEKNINYQNNQIENETKSIY